MKSISFRWLLQRPKTWAHLQHVPLQQLSLLLAAVFLLFSVIGFYNDLMNGGTQPLPVVLVVAAYSGLNAALWVVVVSRLPTIFIFLMAAKEIFVPAGNYLAAWAHTTFHQPPMTPEAGLHFAATAIMIVVLASYVLFSSYIGTAGKEAIRIRNELTLAHSIQKTLVPPVMMTTPCFEIYGVSYPSEKVGGDLVDVVELPCGDVVAYVADIAGHGLQAGILMGMLKTASRMALADPNGAGGAGILSQLMQRLNFVLPQVKEAHMFATLTCLRLDRDGQSFYGMSACPPLLLWIAERRSVEKLEEPQFPLGLLPMVEFSAHGLSMQPGDVAVIATDGIVEVTPRNGGERGAEFGAGPLEKLLMEHSRLPLAELAKVIVDGVRKYGKQFDDQTLLLIRRRV